jgi:HAD superfamily 5'-nucleotidase-like hydrolase
MTSYMVEHEDFYPEFVQCDMRPEFAAKGLALDLVEGNCLKIDENKIVVKASHGFTPMTPEKIKEMYPEAIEEYNGHKSDRYLTVASYFEVSVCSLFLHAVELTEKHEPDEEHDYYHIMAAFGRGFEYYFGKYPDNKYFQAVMDAPQDYLIKPSQEFIGWLQGLKQRGVKIALITNSFAGYTHQLMNYCYGEKFHELFDVVVVQAIKPSFFTKNESFLEYADYQSEASSAKVVKKLELHRKPLPIFAKGNVVHLVESLEQVYEDEHKENPEVRNDKLKFCYVGDHMIGDVVTPKSKLQWTTIAIVEELDHLYHSNVAPEKGQHWGSFFFHEANESQKFHTFYARLLRESADYCCFSVDDLVHVEEHSLDTSSLKPCIVLKPKI